MDVAPCIDVVPVFSAAKGIQGELVKVDDTDSRAISPQVIPQNIQVLVPSPHIGTRDAKQNFPTPNSLFNHVFDQQGQAGPSCVLKGC